MCEIIPFPNKRAAKVNNHFSVEQLAIYQSKKLTLHVLPAKLKQAFHLIISFFVLCNFIAVNVVQDGR